MWQTLKKSIISVLKSWGWVLIRQQRYDRMIGYKTNWDWTAWMRLESDFRGATDGIDKAEQRWPEFHSQLGQDYLAYRLFGTKGFYVEFGATNGVELSNSYALDKMGWRGILAEPSRRWHKHLKVNRPNAHICTDCVWSRSNEKVAFVETGTGVLDGMESHLNSDHHPREKVKSYEVNTVSLIDLLKMYDAPRFVEYLSIDTEGSEYDILSAFDWESYRFGLISVEHNFTNNRERIERVLTANGYRRILTDLSKFDDWYVAEGLFF